MSIIGGGMTTIKPLIAVGFPKSGTHALQRALLLLGLGYIPTSHLPYANRHTDQPYAFIKRDPRNVVISRVRWQQKPVTEEWIVHYLRQWNERRTMGEALAAFEGWLMDPDAVQVTFERLVTEPREMQRLGEGVRGRWQPERWRELRSGESRTYTGQLSNWPEHWTPRIEGVWEECCAGVLGRWGYE